MKASISWAEYQRLEGITPPQSWHKGWRSHLPHWLWTTMGLFRLSLGHNPEIRVWRRLGAEGELLWSGYDPMGDRHIHDVSEEHLRRWIEQRYR